MASHVQIILRRDLPKLGQTGDLVRVRSGYARNFLIPRGVAVMATRENQQEIEHERRLAMVRIERQRAELVARAEKIEGTRIQIAKEAGADGKLFGSVTAQDIADALAKVGVEADRKQLELPESSIKATGPYDLRLKIGRDVFARFRLDVTTKA